VVFHVPSCIAAHLALITQLIRVCNESEKIGFVPAHPGRISCLLVLCTLNWRGGGLPHLPHGNKVFSRRRVISLQTKLMCAACVVPHLPHSLSHLPPAPPLQPPSKAQQHTWSSWGARVDGCAGSSLLPAVARCSASPSTSNRCSSVLGMGMEEGLS
jgi:hypothetical protein